MIVKEPPYELVALFSDLEMQKLFEALLERGQERRCIRPFRWRSLRDPRRDTVWREPDRLLTPFLTIGCRFIIAWDHHGSGGEADPPSEVEARVIRKLVGVGITQGHVLAIAFEPEVESVFEPVWPRVKSIISRERSSDPPSDEHILAETKNLIPQLSAGFDSTFARHPKEVFEAMVRLLRLRRAAPLYAKLGSKISLPGLKRSPAALRVASAVESWFPPV